jgi:hypothetical protein
VIPVIERHRDELNRLCRRFHVRRLELFGSAAAGRFEPGKSDLDFLVEFDSLAPGDYADSYFGLLESLAELYGSAVDLVVPTAVHNPYFRASIEKNRSLLYAA